MLNLASKIDLILSGFSKLPSFNEQVEVLGISFKDACTIWNIWVWTQNLLAGSQNPSTQNYPEDNVQFISMIAGAASECISPMMPWVHVHTPAVVCQPFCVEDLGVKCLA